MFGSGDRKQIVASWDNYVFFGGVKLVEFKFKEPVKVYCARICSGAQA